MMTWEQHAEAFAHEEQAAIVNRTCFCLCGDRTAEAVAFPVTFGTDPVAGLCAACGAARKTKKGAKAHKVLRRALDNWTEPDEPQEAPRRHFLARMLDAKHLTEATDFARSYGTEGGRFMVMMSEKVRAGGELTVAQAEAVLRSKAADGRSARAAFKRSMAESRRKGKTEDLTRIRLDDVRDGDYAVEGDAGDIVILRVRRPRTGPIHGFTVVESLVGEGVTRYGVQRPHPSRDLDRFASTYTGYMPHLVAALAADPLGARIRYEQLTGKPT